MLILRFCLVNRKQTELQPAGNVEAVPNTAAASRSQIVT